MNVYCSDCKLGDYQGVQCLNCKKIFQYICTYCGTHLTTAGACKCMHSCKNCQKTHSRRVSCRFFNEFGKLRDKINWEGSLKIGLDYPSTIKKPLDGKSIIVPTFSSQVQRDTPVAKCSFHYRYNKNKGKGALKYDPVMCSGSGIYDEKTCMHLRELRGWGNLSFQFCLALAPGCENFTRKLMVVPSVGCPKALTVENILKRLLWVNEASERPVVILVHDSELEIYLAKVGEMMKKFGVGIVAWRCDRSVLGFGTSRLAAQQCRILFFDSPFQVILCDVNVAASSSIPKPKKKPPKVTFSKTVEEGYSSDDEDWKGWKNSTTFVYMSSGYGTGIPTLKMNEGTKSLEKTGASKGGNGRPVEQIVVVGDDELLYDPCFITSSEDADMTANVEYELSFCMHDDDDDLVRKSNATIDKIEFLEFGNLTDAYMKLRTKYLESLGHEDNILIEYHENKESTEMTVGGLALKIANLYNLDPLVIRSLIIEKILLAYKLKYIYI